MVRSAGGYSGKRSIGYTLDFARESKGHVTFRADWRTGGLADLKGLDTHRKALPQCARSSLSDLLAIDEKLSDATLSIAATVVIINRTAPCVRPGRVAAALQSRNDQYWRSCSGIRVAFCPGRSPTIKQPTECCDDTFRPTFGDIQLRGNTP